MNKALPNTMGFKVFFFPRFFGLTKRGIQAHPASSIVVQNNSNTCDRHESLSADVLPSGSLKQTETRKLLLTDSRNENNKYRIIDGCSREDGTDAICSHPNPPKNASLGLRELNERCGQLLSPNLVRVPTLGKSQATTNAGRFFPSFRLSHRRLDSRLQLSHVAAVPHPAGEKLKKHSAVRREWQPKRQTDVESQRGIALGHTTPARYLGEGTKDNFGRKQQNAPPRNSNHITVNCENYGINSKLACVCTYDKGTAGTGPRVQPQPLPQASSPSIFTNPTPNHGPRL